MYQLAISQQEGFNPYRLTRTSVKTTIKYNVQLKHYLLVGFNRLQLWRGGLNPRRADSEERELSRIIVAIPTNATPFDHLQIDEDEIRPDN